MHAGGVSSNLYAMGLGLLLTTLIAFDVRDDVRRLLTGRNVVLAGILAWYVLECLMLPADLRTSYTQSQFDLGVLCVALAAGCFLLGYHETAGCPWFPRLAEQVCWLDDVRWLWRFVAIGALVGFLPILYYGGNDLAELFRGILGMRQTWGGTLSRGRYGDARAAFLMFELFLTGVAPFAAVLLLTRDAPLGQRAFSALVLAWTILRAYGSGTRSSLITAIVPVLAVIYFRTPRSIQRIAILMGLASLPMAYGIMAAIAASRGQGAFSWEAGESVDYVGNEMFRELLFIMSKVPRDLDYLYGYSYYVQLVNPIPRFLWPDKPKLETGLLLAQLYGAIDSRTGEAYLTVSPGLIGEMYLNFGWVGVAILSTFGGWLVRGWDRIAEHFGQSLAASMYHSAGLATLFILGRSFSMPMFYGLLSGALLVLLLVKLIPQKTVDR